MALDVTADRTAVVRYHTSCTTLMYPLDSVCMHTSKLYYINYVK